MIINNMYGHFFRLRLYRNDYTIHNSFFLKYNKYRLYQGSLRSNRSISKGTTGLTFRISHTKHLYIKYMPLNCCGEFRFLSMRLMQLFVFLVVTLSNIIAFLSTVEGNAHSKIATAETI
jgi:hypothetical protein